MKMQALLHAVYPPHCLGCEALTDQDFALCPECWAKVPFVTGLSCQKCGLPLPGEGDEALCDDCLRVLPPWDAARSPILYRQKGRELVLALKHGDRMDLSHLLGPWMARCAAEFIPPDDLQQIVVAPIPLHWSRLFSRFYNQSALLSDIIANTIFAAHIPDLLLRKRRTEKQDGKSREERFSNLQDAIDVHPRHLARVKGAAVLVIDDVMTTGATFAAATSALKRAGAKKVYILPLARVAKDA